MPRIKIDYVVSFSSEDAENPASNLLATEVSKKKWLCSKGSESCSVVLQLARTVQIAAVHVGVHHAALLEVLVGRSEISSDSYKVLVPRCVFLSPIESRRDEAVEKFRSFNSEQLAADVKNERWDRIRVVCSQPYNKHCKYGLSFIHIFEPEGKASTTSTPLSQAPSVPARLFSLESRSSDEEDNFKPGELFAKHLQSKTGSASSSTDAQIRQASSQALKNISESATKLVKTPISKEKCKSSTNKESDSNIKQRNNLMYDDGDASPNAKIDKIVHRHNEEKKKKDESANKTSQSKHYNRQHESEKYKKDDFDSAKIHKDNKQDQSEKGHSNRHKHSDPDRSHYKYKDQDRSDSSRSKDRSHEKIYDKNKTVPETSKKDRDRNWRKEDEKVRKRLHPDDNSSNQTNKRLCAGPRSSSPHTLLRGVVFVMSGYENPRRACVRDQALAMGARYAQQWDHTCTHLICAFPNTPKLRAVRSGPKGSSARVVTAEWVEESCARARLLPWQWFATEPHLRQPRPEGDGEDEEKPPSECDTDDEIEKVLQNQRKFRNKTTEPTVDETDGNLNSKSEKKSSTDDTSFSEYNESTDEELTESTKEVVRNRLPDFFDGLTFAIEDQVQEAGFDRNLIATYIRAYGGEILERELSSSADYVLCGSSPSPVPGEAGPRRRRADWLWRCHAAGTLLDT